MSVRSSAKPYPQRAAPGCALLLAFVASATHSAPSINVAGNRDRLSLVAEDVSLRQAIDYLAQQQALSVLAYGALDERIAVQILEEPLHEVLQRLLRDHSFTLLLDEADGRLWIYPHAADTMRGEPLRLGRGADRDGRRGNSDGLSAWGRSDSFRAFRDAMADSRAGIRAEAVVTLAEEQGVQALPELAGLLDDPDDEVVTVAMEELADMGNPAAVAELGRLLQSGDAGIRIRVVDLLADTDGVPATRLLERAVTDPDTRVQSLAAQYLAERRRSVRIAKQ